MRCSRVIGYLPRFDKDEAAHIADMKIRKMSPTIVISDEPLISADVAFEEHDVMRTHCGCTGMGMGARKESCPIRREVESGI